MRRFPADVVRDILISCESETKLAAKHHTSRRQVNNIRMGITHADLFPDLPRCSGSSCLRCIHWVKGQSCGLGFPEPMHEGFHFAAFCNAFREQQRRPER